MSETRVTGEILLAIDPGNIQSAFCFVDIDTYKPLYFAKEENADVMRHIVDYVQEHGVRQAAIEMIASMGMPIGKSTIDTAMMVGRFAERLEMLGVKVSFIYRKDEKMCICGQMKAKDSNIRQALIDRFAQHDLSSGKGTKSNPDWFYGFRADIWQSYATATTWIDAKKGLYELKG